MKFGIRIPNLNKRIAARLSLKRIIRHSLKIKAPKGWGWITDPKRAAYNKVYNQTSRGCLIVLPMLLGYILIIIFIIFNTTNYSCPIILKETIKNMGLFL